MSDGKNVKVKVLIAAKERGAREQLRQLILGSPRYEIAGTAVDGQEAVQLAVMLKPDIAVVNSDLPILNGFEAAEMIGLAAPNVRSVLIGNGIPTDLALRKAMKSGVRAYLPPTHGEKELLQAIDELSAISDIRGTQVYETATDPSRMPKVIVVTGGKGGTGKTTISTSLAMTLVKHHPGKVVLFDLYTQFGDVATMLDISPTKSLSDLTQMSDEVDIDMLEAHMVEHESGLKVLVSALGLQPIDAVSVAAVENTIHALKRAYTHIVVDLPPILHGTTLYVLSQCYQLILVSVLFDVPAVRDTKKLYDKVVGSYVPEEKVALIANRVSRHDKLAIPDVEKMFGRKFDVQVPNDPRLVASANQGIPFVRAYSKSPLAAAVERIAREVVEKEPVGAARG